MLEITSRRQLVCGQHPVHASDGASDNLNYPLLMSLSKYPRYKGEEEPSAHSRINPIDGLCACFCFSVSASVSDGRGNCSHITVEIGIWPTTLEKIPTGCSSFYFLYQQQRKHLFRVFSPTASTARKQGWN